jgi:hypothetical protein
LRKTEKAAMSRRLNSRYFVDLGAASLFKVSAADWQKAVADRWIEPTAPGSRVARLCAGVAARVKGGVLWLRDTLRDVWVKTSWIAIDNQAPARGEHWQKDIERQYGPYPRGERYGEVYTGFLGMGAAELRRLAQEIAARKQAECGLP